MKVYLKSYFLFHLFFSFFLKWLKSAIFFIIKQHLEEIREGIIKKFNKILIGKTPVERNAICYFYQNLFLLVLTCWKRNTFKISMKFHLKRGKLFLKPYFLLCLMCYIAHQQFIWTTRNLYFRIYFYIAPKRFQKITIIFSTFVTGVQHTSWCLFRPWFMLPMWM